MENIVDFFFEANMLKQLPRSGYGFLGTGSETVAEHSFMTTIICFAMARMEKGLDAHKMVSMALVHDLPEARTGDLNYVQKRYVTAMEDRAVRDMTEGVPWGNDIKILIDEFNTGVTKEAMLVRDADQLSFIIELKKIKDTGIKTPEKWLPYIIARLTTVTGKKLAEKILSSHWDDWWLKNYSETGLNENI